MYITLKHIEELFEDIHKRQNIYGRLYTPTGKGNKSIKLVTFDMDGRSYLYAKNPSWANTIIFMDNQYHRKNQLIDITDMDNLPSIKLMGVRFLDDKTNEDVVSHTLELGKDITVVERGTIKVDKMSTKMQNTIENALNKHPSDNPDYLFKYVIEEQYQDKVMIENDVNEPNRLNIKCLLSNTERSFVGYTWKNDAIYSNVLLNPITGYFGNYKSKNVHEHIVNSDMKEQSDLLGLLHDQYQIILDGRDKFDTEEEQKAIDTLLASMQEQVMKLI